MNWLRTALQDYHIRALLHQRSAKAALLLVRR